MSFVAIQYSQREQVVPVKDKRSLKEIQEEEQSLQEEADFLKWWTAEEERLQRVALAQFENNLSKPSQSSPRKPQNAKSRQKADGKARADHPLPTPGSPLSPQQQAHSAKQTGQSEAQTQQHPRRKPRKPSHKSAAVP